MLGINQNQLNEFKVTSYQDVINLAKKLNISLSHKLDQDQQKEFDEYCKAWDQATAWVEDSQIYYEF